MADRIIRLLNMPCLFDETLTEFTALLLMKVVSFLPDPDAEEKRKQRLANPIDWTTSLEPSPPFEVLEYLSILEKGVRPLAVRAPYLVARLLIDASASMIRMSTHQKDFDREGDEDYLEFRLRQLDRPDRDYFDSGVALIRTLIFACQMVFEESPESVEVLDQALRNQPGKFFMRLRQHLYTQNQSEQTLPWIREFILDHSDYDGMSYDYEFQVMVHRVCAHFGENLLTEEELSKIIDLILSGPLIKTYHLVGGFSGEQFTEEGFRHWQRFYHLRKLRPFAQLLTGEYQSYYIELGNEQIEPLTDEDYLPFRERSGEWVSNRSPQPPEELSKLQDEDLLGYINEWQEEQEDNGDWLNRTNIEALAGAFQAVFKAEIAVNEERLAFWHLNRERIVRPVYVKAIVQAFQENVKEQNFEQLELWFDFCDWVLSHPDEGSEDGVQPHENSREHPDWGSSRREVGIFIGTCLEDDLNTPYSSRRSLAKLLGLLCNQFDWRLDTDKPLVLKRNDQIIEAINNTRSRALNDLVTFGSWVRRHDPDASVPEVTSLLEERFRGDAEYPFTLPERALLGLNFGSVFSLSQSWATEYKADFFPQDELDVWPEAFGNFLLFGHPSGPIFEILQEDYTFSLDHLVELNAVVPSGRDLPDRLGQHLFDYYAWAFFSLNGEDSLLERFYKKTSQDKQRWARLFNHVGRSLRRSKKPLEAELRNRITAFFDWRLNAEDPDELQEFSSWLEAECLDAGWRLDSLSKVLDITPSKDMRVSNIVATLVGMLEDYTAKVVKCYTKMVESSDQSAYFQNDHAKSILAAGLRSEEENVRRDAERAREILLSRGAYALLDL